MTAASLVVSGRAYASALAVLARHTETGTCLPPERNESVPKARIMCLAWEVVKAAPLGRQLAPARRSTDVQYLPRSVREEWYGG